MEKKHLDIHLLRCLLALIEEAHVTKAAERMGSTQPAMSATLRKLRDIFGDPLLVRTEKGMLPTPRATELVGSLRTAIAAIDATLHTEAPFDPATAQMTIQVAASESVSFMLLPHVVARVRATAPGVQLVVHIPDLQRVRQSLEEGRTDLLLSFTRTAPEDLRSAPVWAQKLAVIAAHDHPLGEAPMDRQAYTRWPHAGHRVGRTGSSIEEVIDQSLAALGLRRSIGAWMPSAVSLPAVVAHTDFLATVPEPVARHFAQTLGLRTYEVPLPLAEVQIGMYWHDRTHRLPAMRWLRQLVREVGAQLMATPGPD